MLNKRHSAVICGVALLLLSVPSFAVVNITDMQYLLDNGNTLYTGNSGGGNFSVSESSYMSPAMLLQEEGGTFSTYNVNSASISWSNAPRTAEQSVGNLAKAWFSYANPVTLSISGQLCENGTPIFTGLLVEAQLIADISGQSGAPNGTSFCVWELPTPAPDILAAHVMFDIKGGELYAGTAGKVTQLVISDFELSMELLSSNALSGTVQNFNSDISYSWFPPTQMLMTAVPEPVTIVLFAFGSIGILRRRHAR